MLIDRENEYSNYSNTEKSQYDKLQLSSYYLLDRKIVLPQNN